MSRPPRVLPAGPRLAAKVAAQRHERRHTRRRRMAWILAAVAPMILAGWVLLSSPVLSVRNVIVSGQFMGTIDFGGGPLTTSGPSADAIYLAKLDAAGNHVWSKRFHSAFENNPFHVTTDTGGTVGTVLTIYDVALLLDIKG